MGTYNLKSDILRCQNCYSIRKMTINPGVPQSFVNSECKCDVSNITLKQILEELNKGIPYKIICKICKKEDKNSSFCSNCNHTYCSLCIKDHTKHKYIPISKIDYYCILHQKELFCSYCYDCSVNFCKKCIQEKKHLNHSCCELNKLMMNKNDRNYLKEKFRLAENKLEFGTQFANAFIKKLKKEEDKNAVLNAEKCNLAQNKNILELINFFIYFYDNSKYKNYNIIYNFTENINLNVNKFKITGNNVSLEDAYGQIIKFFNEDFIIIRNENSDNQKEAKNERRDSSKRNKSIWDIDENEIEISGTMNFNSINLKLNENNDKNDLCIYNEKMNNNSSGKKLLNSSNTEKKKKKNAINKSEENNINDNVENIYYRPRSHAIFIPTKIIQKQIEEANQNELKEDINCEREEELEAININQENEEKDIEKGKQTIKEKLIKKVIEEKVKEEKLKEEKLKEEKTIKEIKDEDEEKKEEKEKEECIEENKVNEDKIKIKDFYIINKENAYKYAKFIGINKFRNKTRSIINKMMINGYKNSKFYNINLI